MLTTSLPRRTRPQASTRTTTRRLAVAAAMVVALAATSACASQAPSGDASAAVSADSSAGSGAEGTAGGGADGSAGAAAPGGEVSSDEIVGVEVTGDVGTKPTVTIDSPLDLTASAANVLVEGDGDELSADDQASVQFALFNGTDGAELQSSYEQGSQTVDLDATNSLPAILNALIGQKVGSRLLIGLAPGDGPAADDTTPFKAEDTLLYIVDVIGTVPDTATGEEVTDIPDDLPSVEVDGDNRVTGVTVPGGDAPTDLVVQPLITGEGDPVTADQTLTVQYWGVLWDGGTTFDESWSAGQPATFPLSGVIAGWTEGLAGQTVGSRVLLVIPPDLGYGAEGQPPTIPADATLVFVVDILAAT